MSMILMSFFTLKLVGILVTGAGALLGALAKVISKKHERRIAITGVVIAMSAFAVTVATHIQDQLKAARAARDSKLAA